MTRSLVCFRMMGCNKQNLLPAVRCSHVLFNSVGWGLRVWCAFIYLCCVIMTGFLNGWRRRLNLIILYNIFCISRSNAAKNYVLFKPRSRPRGGVERQIVPWCLSKHSADTFHRERACRTHVQTSDCTVYDYAYHHYDVMRVLSELYY